jgi:ribonuclease HII
MYENFRKVCQTGDINHPDTKEVEKGYMTTLNVNQIKIIKTLNLELICRKHWKNKQQLTRKTKQKEKKV